MDQKAQVGLQSVKRSAARLPLTGRVVILFLRIIFVAAALYCLGLTPGGVCCLAQTGVLNKTGGTKQAQPPGSVSTAAPKAKPLLDPLGRGNPRGTVKGFMQAGYEGDFKRAGKYLDLSGLPRMSAARRQRISEKLYISLRRGMLIDYDLLSDKPSGMGDDGLSRSRERVGFIMLPSDEVEILLKRVRLKSGRQVWLFDPSTIRAVPRLYGHFKLGPVGDFLSSILPNYELAGVPFWQWLAFLAAFLIAVSLARAILALLTRLMNKRGLHLAEEGRRFLRGPLTFIVAVLIVRSLMGYLDLTMEAQAVAQARTFLILGFTWAAVSLVGVLFVRMKRTLGQGSHADMIVLMRPLATVLRVLIVVTATLLWLDNIGFEVTTILASLGIGGIAVALAAQDTLKNVFGSLAILLDKPFQVGDRIVVQGHDGFVEAIGLRSTELRRLDGHQVIIPNETLARLDIHNIGRRPHIRQISDIGISCDTPWEKAAEAVEALRELMENHQGMEGDFPPRVYFHSIDPASLTLRVIYWYHPPDFWEFSQFNHDLNLRIMEEFAKRGIRLAYPLTTALANDPQRPLHLSLGRRRDSEPGGKGDQN